MSGAGVLGGREVRGNGGVDRGVESEIQALRYQRYCSRTSAIACAARLLVSPSISSVALVFNPILLHDLLLIPTLHPTGFLKNPSLVSNGPSILSSNS